MAVKRQECTPTQVSFYQERAPFLRPRPNTPKGAPRLGTPMEFVLRDHRHLKGTTPRVDVAPPTGPGHAVGSGWADGAPYLTVRDDAERLHSIPLDAALDIEVLPERRCIGRNTPEGFVPCPHGRSADHFDQCPDCHPLPERDCVFNPRCSNCTLEFCRSPHRLYLAYYAELPKVGMTRAARGEARLVEQGADAYAILGHAIDRAEVRRLEDQVTNRLGVPQSRRADEVLPRLARPVPWTAIENSYRDLRPKLADLLGMAPGPLERNPPTPGPFPLRAVPTLAGTQGHHAGQVIAAKGRYLLYETGPAEAQDGMAPIWALNLGAIVTHRVHFDPETAKPLPNGA